MWLFERVHQQAMGWKKPLSCAHLIASLVDKLPLYENVTRLRLLYLARQGEVVAKEGVGEVGMLDGRSGSVLDAI